MVDAVIFIAIACGALLLSTVNALTLFRVRRVMSDLETTLTARNKEISAKTIELQKQSLLILELSRLLRFVLHPDHEPTDGAREQRIHLIRQVERAEHVVTSRIFKTAVNE